MCSPLLLPAVPLQAVGGGLTEVTLHPLLPALQLLALGWRKDMASPLLLERSLLGGSGGIWLVRRLPVFTCHDVLPKVSKSETDMDLFKQ